MLDEKDLEAYRKLLEFFNKAKFELDVRDCVSLTQVYTTCYKMQEKLGVILKKQQAPAKKVTRKKTVKNAS